MREHPQQQRERHHITQAQRAHIEACVALAHSSNRKMQHRHQSRTHRLTLSPRAAALQHIDTTVPRSMVFRRGKTAGTVKQLVGDMRRVMSPYTALELKVGAQRVRVSCVFCVCECRVCAGSCVRFACVAYPCHVPAPPPLPSPLLRSPGKTN